MYMPAKECMLFYRLLFVKDINFWNREIHKYIFLPGYTNPASTGFQRANNKNPWNLSITKKKLKPRLFSHSITVSLFHFRFG